MTRVFTMSDLHLNFIVEGTDFKHAVHDANLTCTTQKQREKLFNELFFEHTTMMLPDGDASKDILVIAGDTWEGHNWIKWNNLSWIAKVSRRFAHVVMTIGNHDLWGHNILTWKQRADKMLLKIGVHNVHILDNSAWLHAGTDTLFVGGTLWTDMNRGCPITQFNAAQTMVPDYRYIKQGSSYKKWTASQNMLEHYKTKDFIGDACKNNLEKDIVVVTHHLPSYKLCDEKYAGDPSNHYYASSCEQIMAEHDNLKVWCAGHTHSAKDLTIYGTRCIVNPHGYVFTNGRTENTGFDKNKHFIIGGQYAQL